MGIFRRRTHSIADTSTEAFSDEMIRESKASWKKIIDVQKPYQWNLKRLKPGQGEHVGGRGNYFRLVVAVHVRGYDFNALAQTFIKGNE